MSREAEGPRLVADNADNTDSPAPFLEREQEVTLLWEQAEKAQHGHATVVLLTGVPGIGKTRLLREALASLAPIGATTLSGRASPAIYSAPSYLPFLEALHQYIQATPGDQLQTQLKMMSSLAQRALISVLPEVAAYVDDGSSSQTLSLPPAQMHLQLCDALASFLAAIAGSAGLVLGLDDLQWADAASFHLLQHVVSKWSHARLLIIGALQSGALEQNTACAHSVADLVRQQALTIISLGPLTAAGTLQFARACLGGPVDSALGQCLSRRSEGHPLAIEELLRHWREMHVLSRQHGKWIATAPLAGTLPPSLSLTLRHWIAQMPDCTLQLLRTSAVIGRKVDVSLLATVVGQDVAVVEEALQEAAHAQLISLDRSGTFRFGHQMVHECLYDMLGACRRQLLHRHVGEALEARLRHEEGVCVERLIELARHFDHGGDPARAAHHTRCAADESVRTASACEAMAFYRTAHQALDHPHPNVRVGWNSGNASSPEPGRQRPALLGDVRESATNEASEHAAALLAQPTLRAARQTLEDSLALLGSTPRVETVHLLLTLCALLSADLGQPAEGKLYAQQALEMARRLGDTRLECKAVRAMMGSRSIRGRELTSSIQMIEYTRLQAEIRDDPAEAACYCAYLATLSYCSGRLKRSWEFSMLRAAWEEQSGQPSAVEQMHLWLAILCATRGDWSAAERMFAYLHSASDRAPANRDRARFFHPIRGFLAYQRNDYVTATHEFEALEMYLPQGIDNLDGGEFLVAFPGLYGLTQLAAGNRAKARSSMAALERLLARIPTDSLAAAPLMTCLALLAIGLGEQDRFSDLYDRLEPFQGQLYWFLVDRVRGMLATLRGDWAAASQHLEAAEATARREGLLPELGRILAAQAHLELASGRQGSSARDADLSREEHEILRLLQIPPVGMGISHRYRPSPSSQADDCSWPEHPAGLSPREVSVLQLVAAGKSNLQIARELHLSEKTVANHLTHIFEKTGSENRAAATAFAIRHQIV